MNEEQLINALCILANKLNTKYISQTMLDADPDSPSSSTYKRIFGSWKQALLLAGLRTGIITGRPWDEAINISEKAVEIIEGELLGDGSLELTPTSGNSGFVHSTANIDYSIYLEQKLLNTGICVNYEILPPRNGGRKQRRIRTQYNQSFKFLWDRWYPNNEKIVPKDLVLTETKCLHWYLGDGYIEKKNVKISTCGFTWDEVRQLSIMIGELGFKTSIDRHSGGYPVLRFLTAPSLEFLKWLGPCPVIGYEHRWILLNGDSNGKT